MRTGGSLSRYPALEKRKGFVTLYKWVGRISKVPGIRVGWRPYEGILRKVTLQATGLCYVSEVRIVAERLHRKLVVHQQRTGDRFRIASST